MDIKSFSIPKEMLESADVLCLFGFEESLLKSQLETFLKQKDKEVFVVHRENFHVLEEFLTLSQKRIFQVFAYLVSPFLEEEERIYMEQLVVKCQMIEWNTHVQGSDYQDLGVKVFENLYQNLLLKSDVRGFSSLKGSLKQIPAFICGGGPSLKKAIPYLKDLKHKGVIFAGGASLSSSIPFHIAAGIDPDPSFERCLMQEGFEAPFFFQERFSHELLKRVQGCLIQAPSHSGITLEGHSLDFDGGSTVTTFCASLALHLGCNPIFFIGMDLVYEDEKNKYFEKKTQEERFKPSAIYQDALSQKDWVIAAKWLENLASLNEDTSFYTLSENGLQIEGLEKVSYKELFERTKTSFDVEGTLHVALSNVRSEMFSLEEREEKRKAIETSLKQSLEIINQILLLFETTYPEDPSSSGNFLLQLFALYNQIVYQNLLEPLWKVWRHPLERTVSDEYLKKIHQWLFFKKVLEVHLKA